MTTDELLFYLEQMTKLAKAAPDISRNAESICADMWKQFTPEALDLWTIPGVLEHVAQCIAETEPELGEDVEEDDDD